jgi:aspartyl/asparaginyl beta-hydroxylase (cupin superfamily)
MRFFALIRSEIDVAPLLREVHANEGAWSLDKTRQTQLQVQRHTNAVFIRGQVHRTDLASNDNQENRYTKVSKSFPKAVAFMESIATEFDATLSRAVIVRLQPRTKVYMHRDAGSYYLIRDRYHLVLYSPAGSLLRSGDEEIRMRVGELWWFNNKQFHEASNDSDEWRIHYIFDLLPRAYAHLAVNPIPLADTKVS